MKIELWAKKVDRGHVKIGEVDVPDNFGYTYRIPVKNEISVMSPNSIITGDIPVNSARCFVYQYSHLDKIINQNRRYIEQ